MSNKKTEELSSVFSRSIKTKKILESFYSEALLRISENQDLVNKKDRGLSINSVSYYCYFLVVFLLDFQSNIFLEICQIKNRRSKSSVPPKQSVYSGVCHRLVLTSKIAIGFRSGVRHRLTLMFKITIRLTLSRPLIYYKYNIYIQTYQETKSNKKTIEKTL